MKCRNRLKCVCEKNVHERFEHFKPVLEKYGEGNLKEKKKILKKAPSCLVRLFSECGHNILKGNVKLPDAQYKKLKPHKRLLLLMSNPSKSLKEKKFALLKKKGGFIQVVLPYLLTALSGFAGQALAKSVL